MLLAAPTVIAACFGTGLVADGARPAPPEPTAEIAAYDQAVDQLKELDGKVYALQWVQQTTVRKGDNPSYPFVRMDGWIDARDHYCLLQHFVLNDAEGGSQPMDRENYFDGEWVTGVTRLQAHWVRRPELNDLFNTATPLSYLGRADVSYRTTLLSTTLSKGVDRSFEKLPNGNVRLGAIVEHMQSLTLLTVELDPSKGMYPVCIAEHDSVFRTPYRVYTTTSWTTFQGVLLPKTGMVKTTTEALTKEQRQAINAAVKAKGFKGLDDWWSDRLDSLHQLRAIVDDVMKGEKIPLRDVGNGEYTATFWYKAINEGVTVPPPPPPPPGFVQGDDKTGEAVLPDGTRLKPGEGAPKKATK